MGYVFLGHGGLDVDPSVTPQDMEWVAIPQGTTIQFYADTGQRLRYGAKELDAFSQLTKHLNAADSTQITLNLILVSAKDLWAEELKNSPNFGGHTLIRAGVDGVPDPTRMCTGTRETCPTDPRQVAEGKEHTCEGILAKFKGELHWMACTEIVNASKDVKEAVDAARGDAQRDVIPGRDPDLVVGPGTPAGWYEDPSKRHESRYWDGSAWTQHVADRGTASTDPM